MILNKSYSILAPMVSLYNRRAYSLVFTKYKKFAVEKIFQAHNYRILDRSYADVAGIPGSGVGKGGGGGGSVRESGGGLGKYGAAKEESYFYDKQKKLLEQLKKQRKNTDKTLPKGTE